MPNTSKTSGTFRSILELYLKGARTVIIPRLIEPLEWQTMEETGERWVDFSLSVLRDHKSGYTSNEVGVAGIVTLL